MEKFVKWEPPPNGFVKINVDGSSLGNPGPTGFGGVCRDDFGQWFAGFSNFLGIATNMNAEASVVLYALHFASEKNYRKLIIETDSQEVYRACKYGVSDHHPYGGIFMDIANLCTSFDQVEFSHVLREGNQAADKLAKWGASHRVKDKRWIAPPPSLEGILFADSIGVLFCR